MGIRTCRGPFMVRALAPACLLPLLLTACGEQDPAFTESRDMNRRGGADGTAGIPQSADDMNGGEGNTDHAGPGGPVDVGGPGSDTVAGAPETVWIDTDGDGLPDTEVTTGEVPAGTEVTWADTDGDGKPDTRTPPDTGTGTGTGGKDSGEGGVNLTTRTVTMTQKGPGKVDILWIVDTSGSMSEEQEYLSDNFNALITQLQKAGHNFQTAITTTDVCDNTVPADLSQRRCPQDYGGSSSTHLRGSFVGEAGRRVLKQGDADLVARFNQYTMQGINGSGFEHGLEAARMAVDKVGKGDNEPLIRPDAFLAVIVVSDEQDDGIGLWEKDAYHNHNFAEEGLTTFKFTEDDMIGYLKGVKGAGKFSVSAITGTRKADGAMCSAAHSQPKEEGTQYIKAAQKTGGVVQSICETDWNASLGTIGLDLSAQITQVALPSAADAATIKVWVSGVQSSQWSYIEGNNAVRFNAGYVPAEGAEIKVTYVEKK